MGRPAATWAPLAWDLLNAAVRVIPEPETSAPAACANFSGAATVTVAPLLPLVMETTTALS